MRVIRQKQYKLIMNIAHQADYPIAQDLWDSETFQDMLNRVSNNQSLNWYRTLEQYRSRPQWELYDVVKDPKELQNLANLPEYNSVLKQLQQDLINWRKVTNDPWVDAHPCC